MRTIAVFLILSTISVLLWTAEGASYVGADQNAAREILQYSDRNAAYGIGPRGHSRDHVQGRVEQASRAAGVPFKNGFYTADNQYEAAHRILSYANNNNLMAPINSAAAHAAFKGDKTGFNVDMRFKRVEVVISSADLGYKTTNNTADRRPRPPRVGRWKGGDHERDFEMTGVKAILQHRRGEQLTTNANVHVQTLYPMGPGPVTSSG